MPLLSTLPIKGLQSLWQSGTLFPTSSIASGAFRFLLILSRFGKSSNQSNWAIGITEKTIGKSLFSTRKNNPAPGTKRKPSAGLLTCRHYFVVQPYLNNQNSQKSTDCNCFLQSVIVFIPPLLLALANNLASHNLFPMNKLRLQIC